MKTINIFELIKIPQEIFVHFSVFSILRKKLIISGMFHICNSHPNDNKKKKKRNFFGNISKVLKKQFDGNACGTVIKWMI